MPDLTEREKEFLAFALALAFDEMVSSDGFTEADWSVHEKLKKITEDDGA